MRRFASLIYLVVIIALGLLVYDVSGDNTEYKEVKAYKKGSAIDFKDSVRMNVPDSITITPGYSDSYTVWFSGMGIKLNQEIVIEKPE